MKKEYLLLFFLLGITLLLNCTSLYYSLVLYTTLHHPSFASYASSDTGVLSLTVESPPGTENETPSSVGGGSSGGGGGVTTRVPINFSITPNEISLRLISAHNDVRNVIIKNNGASTILIDVSATGIGPYVFFDANRFILKSGEQRTVIMGVNAPEPGTYPGKLFFVSGAVIKEVFVLLDVVSEGVLFDVSLIIPDAYKTIHHGDTLPVSISLRQLGVDTPVNATGQYFIKDFDGTVIFSDSQLLVVSNRMNFTHQLPTANLAPGDYMAAFEFSYPGGFATASAHFIVAPPPPKHKIWIAVFLGVLAIFVVLLAIYFYRRDSHTLRRGRV